jgi:hypothetical protein
LFSLVKINAQGIDTLSQLSSIDSMNLLAIDSLYGSDTIALDTLFYAKFVPYDKQIYRNSKINLRKTLTASKNPPIRKNLNNYYVFVWSIFIALLIIFFKSNYSLQYRLLNKSWYSRISLNEFFDTQTSVFKNSKLLTWFIISQSLALGIYIVIKSAELKTELTDFLLILVISVSVIVLLIANQWLKNLFAYSFSQPSLSKDYAIIYRINSYIASLVLMPFLIITYYNSDWNIRTIVIVSLVIYVLVVYSISLVKFIFSGRFLQNQSNFILILYLCAFEILPLLALIKSINNLLEHD